MMKMRDQNMLEIIEQLSMFEDQGRRGEEVRDTSMFGWCYR